MIMEYSIVFLKKDVIAHPWDPSRKDRTYPAGSRGTILESEGKGMYLIELPGDLDDSGFVSTYYHAEVPESDLEF